VSTSLPRRAEVRRQAFATEVQGATAAPTSAEARDYSPTYVWYVIVLLFVVNAFSLMDRQALAMLAPAVKADLDLSDAQLGLLTGFAFALFYAVCAIPIARWADTGIRRDIIMLALATWSVMTALCGAAQNFWQLFLARVGVGAGEAGGAPTAQSLLCDYVPLARRPLALAINTFGGGAGLMLGMILAGWLGETIGWRWTFAALGAPGVVLALLVRLTLHEPQRGRFEIRHASERVVTSLGRTLWSLWRCRTYRLLMTYAALSGLVLSATLQWGPTFLMRVHGLEPSFVGTALGAVTGAGMGIGLLTGGFVASKAAERDVRWPLLIGVGAVALMVPAAVAAYLVPSPRASIFFVFAFLSLNGVASAPVVATIYSVVRARMRATAGAVSIFSQSVVGAGLGPFVVGLLSDAMYPTLGTESLRYALLAPVFFLPPMVVALHAAAKALPRDLDALGTRG
jgi:predicted MFS family arabinose efflux permease